MKNILILILFSILISKTTAQESSTPSDKVEKQKSDIRKKADERFKQTKEKTSTSVINKPAERIEAAVDKAVDKALDKVGSDIMGIFKKKNKNPDSLSNQNTKNTTPVAENNETTTQSVTNTIATETPPSDEIKEAKPLEVTTKNTFKRGSRIIFEENFEKDAVGDFPARWNTSKSGEVVQLSGQTSKYLKVNNLDNVYPMLSKELPENFTIEFDMIYQKQPTEIQILFSEKAQKSQFLSGSRIELDIRANNDAFDGFHYNIVSKDNSANNEIREAITQYANKPIHIALEINGKRLRFYFDGVKKIDLPQAFEPHNRKNFSIRTKMANQVNKTSACYLTNLIIAETTTDTRSNILKEFKEKGTFSTTAILFETNSAMIKGENSATTIASIAQALNEDKTLTIKIIGHTDNVGEAKKNEWLSLSRANSIKTELITKFDIDPSRLMTEGKGSTSPVADNATEEGKAANRRVEFVVVK